MKRIRTMLSLVIMALYLVGCAGNPSEKGVEYLENGQYNEAIEQFEKAVEAEVNVGDAYRGIGIAKWEQADYEGARDAFENALNNGAQKTGTLYNFLGSCELRLQNPVMAQNYFRIGIELEDSSVELVQEMRYNMIVAYEQSEDWESAKTALREYVADYADDTDAQKELEFLETR